MSKQPNKRLRKEKRLADEQAAKQKAEEEKRLADEQAAKQKAEEEKRLADEQAAKQKAEEEKRLADEEAAKQKAEEKLEAQIKADKIKAEEVKKRLAREQAEQEKAEQEKAEQEALRANNAKTSVDKLTSSAALVADKEMKQKNLESQKQELTNNKERTLTEQKHKKSQAIAAKEGTVVFKIHPWGNISVNGKTRGASPPLNSITLKEGNYSIVINNGNDLPVRYNITVKAGETTTVIHKF
ncbi:PEGA domain-containing protein [Pelistega indica]|uniref:PEGA domain-containing protein n=1 Tax=Pelistega indica TaxID=1414851 RepID=UPI00068CAAA3|nr:PEGA domain-containing protein [Pelistega indica]